MARTAEAAFLDDTRAPSEARRFVRTTLTSWGLVEQIDVAELLTSEIVTNAITHARSAVRLIVRTYGQRLKIEAWDDGRGDTVPMVVEHAVDAESGRGLVLVEKLSAQWGFQTSGPTKGVWFELVT